MSKREIIGGTRRLERRSAQKTESDRRRLEEARLDALLEIERTMRCAGTRLIAGVDEAGRGPLAGPVVAAAVVFPPDARIRGVDDSKRLTPERRAELYDVILGIALAAGVGVVDHRQIDRVNILNATFEAMRQAVAALAVRPDHLLIDGNRFTGGSLPFTAVIGGDALCFSVAAASIVAKVTRDRLMVAFDAEYPGYGFAQHKGYGTPAHREALFRLGPCPIHRRSFLSAYPAAAGGEAAEIALLEGGTQGGNQVTSRRKEEEAGVARRGAEAGGTGHDRHG